MSAESYPLVWGRTRCLRQGGGTLPMARMEDCAGRFGVGTAGRAARRTGMGRGAMPEDAASSQEPRRRAFAIARPHRHGPHAKVGREQTNLAARATNVDWADPARGATV